MQARGFGAGLTLEIPSPKATRTEPEEVLTEEAGLRAAEGQAPHVEILTDEGASVPQGAPVARLRDFPEVQLVAPMPARVGRVALLQGHRLSEIVLFHDAGGDTVRLSLADTESEAGLRRLMQNAGVWPLLRRRPFGGMPSPSERPAAIFVMAADTRPLALDPRQSIEGRDEDIARGLRGLARLTEGPVFVCQSPGSPLVSDEAAGRVTAVTCGPRHPHGLAGIRIHELFPAGIEAPVWDVHAEDVAALGALLETGELPMTRLVAIGGPALRESRVVRTQRGADLRGLTHRIVGRGGHVLMSGSAIDGHASHWLDPRHRQVTVMPRPEAAPPAHWLIAALTRSATATPVIPTAALDQSFGSILPAAAFVRALSSGDEGTAMRMGILSLLEEDLALADYILGGDARLARALRSMLDRIEVEMAA